MKIEEEMLDKEKDKRKENCNLKNRNLKNKESKRCKLWTLLTRENNSIKD